MTHTLTHELIEQGHYVDLYVMDRLDEEKENYSKTHFMDCDQCLGQLEWAQAHVRDLKATASEDWPQERPSLMVRLRTWLTVPQLVMVTTIVLLVVSLGWFQRAGQGEEVLWQLQATRAAQGNEFNLGPRQRPVIMIDSPEPGALSYRLELFAGNELVWSSSGKVENAVIRQHLKYTQKGNYILALELAAEEGSFALAGEYSLIIK